VGWLTLIADAGPRAPPIAHQPPATAETITSTAHHPFWDVTTGRWTDATDLHVGDRLRQTGSSTSTVTKVENTYTAPQTEYNLTVNDLHAYYVDAGIAPILVHNSECPNNIHAEGEDCHCDNPLEPGTRKGDATAEAVDKATQIFKDVHDHSLQKTGTAKVGDSNIKHTFPSGPTDIILGSAAAIHLIAIGVKSGIKWWLRRSAE
jgi:hypothetical protein